MNVVFFLIVAISFAVAAYHQIVWVPPAEDAVSPMGLLGKEMLEAAKGAVTLALGLIGVMALFLGLMKVVEKGGLLVIIARVLRPVMVRLFPEVPQDHPAMGAVIMNISANVLGLGNAATPFGIRAMEELDKLNPQKGTATNAMALFLAINTSAVTLLPTGVIAVRSQMGSNDPAGIVATTIFATIISTTVAIFAAKTLQRFWTLPAPSAKDKRRSPKAERKKKAASEGTAKDVPIAEAEGAYPTWVSVLVLMGIAALVPLSVLYAKVIAVWLIPALVLALLSFGFFRKVNVYEAVVEGGKAGFEVALRIIPYLVAILVALAMLRASGTLDLIIQPLGMLTEPLGLPGEALPMALMRPLSGSGAYGIMIDTMQANGPDSYVGYLVSTFQGSTETSFYVLAVYFGAVGIRRIRHALVAALCADVAGIAAATFIVSRIYGG